jgi:hypothetical protein
MQKALSTALARAKQSMDGCDLQICDQARYVDIVVADRR